MPDAPAVLCPPLPSPPTEGADPVLVTLADGSQQSLAGMTEPELHQLQWDQEQAFAAAICHAPACSDERQQTTAVAYETICTILAVARGDQAGELSMGMDARYVRLVLELLGEQRRRGVERPALFEVGYGSGEMLEQVLAAGYEVAGIEIAETMRGHALARLGVGQAEALLLGDVRDVRPGSLPTQPTAIYWNDVFEHIPVDEIELVVEHLYRLLPPGGVLTTITPNWLLRPSDVTADFCPPRSEARGLHLKEYRLGELRAILRRVGFRRVATPLFATRRRLVRFGGGLCHLKCVVEPAIDRLPLRPAHLLCRGLAMSCTIAAK